MLTVAPDPLARGRSTFRCVVRKLPATKLNRPSDTFFFLISFRTFSPPQELQDLGKDPPSNCSAGPVRHKERVLVIISLGISHLPSPYVTTPCVQPFVSHLSNAHLVHLDFCFLHPNLFAASSSQPRLARTCFTGRQRSWVRYVASLHPTPSLASSLPLRHHYRNLF